MTTATDLQPVPADAERSALRRGVVLTIAYADVFDFPLSSAEIHRYLVGHAASPAAVDELLDDETALGAHVGRTGEWFHLSGRAGIVETRRRRADSSARLWSIARRYAAAIARLPLVRFVGVTGALAMDNAEPGSDVDLFILASPGRLWLCRLLVLAVVRVAALRGVRVCPNFLLSTDRLELRERNLFTAHEVAQMIPVAPTRWYDAFRAANRWTEGFLPNARGSGEARPPAREQRLARIASRVLEAGVFNGLERWEMDRKIRRLRARSAREGGSVAFSAGECRGHFAAHDVRALAAFAKRVADVEDVG